MLSLMKVPWLSSLHLSDLFPPFVPSFMRHTARGEAKLGTYTKGFGGTFDPFRLSHDTKDGHVQYMSGRAIAKFGRRHCTFYLSCGTNRTQSHDSRSDPHKNVSNLRCNPVVLHTLFYFHTSLPFFKRFSYHLTMPILEQAAMPVEPTGGETYKHQDKLQKLPIPDLEGTAARYLASVKPLQVRQTLSIARVQTNLHGQ